MMILDSGLLFGPPCIIFRPNCFKDSFFSFDSDNKQSFGLDNRFQFLRSSRFEFAPHTPFSFPFRSRSRNKHRWPTALTPRYRPGHNGTVALAYPELGVRTVQTPIESSKKVCIMYLQNILSKSCSYVY